MLVVRFDAPNNNVPAQVSATAQHSRTRYLKSLIDWSFECGYSSYTVISMEDDAESLAALAFKRGVTVVLHHRGVALAS